MGEYLGYLVARGNERPGLMIYFDLLDQLEEGEYTTEEAGELFLAFLRYGRYGEIPSFRDRGLKALWHDARRKIDRDGEAWEKKVMGSLYATYARERKDANPGTPTLTKAEWMEREIRSSNHIPRTARNEALTEHDEPLTERLEQEQEREQEKQPAARNENRELITTPATAKIKIEQGEGTTDGGRNYSGDARGEERGGDLLRNVDADRAETKRDYPRSWVDMFNIPTFTSPEDDPLA